MIIIDFIKILKENVKENCRTFGELLIKSQNLDFKDKNKILDHFSNVKIVEKNNLIHLKYDSKKMFKLSWNDFYMQSRGIVIDWKAEKIVLHPFDKFFELDEHKNSTLHVVRKQLQTDQIKEFTDKIDGSLIFARYYDNQIIVASSGSLEGIHVKLAEDIINKSDSLYDFIKTNSNCTVIMEIKSSKYPQLIKYETDSLTVIGMRNMDTNHLLYRNEIIALSEGYNLDIVELKNLTIEEILNIIDEPTNESEGYVLRIGDLLVKFKSKNFVMANRFMGEPSRNFNMMVEAINEGRVEAIRELVKGDFLESYDIGVNTLNRYVEGKRAFIMPIYNELSPDLTKEQFIWAVREKHPNLVDFLIQIKVHGFIPLIKEDIKYLKDYSTYFTCVSHFKYAEIHGFDLKEVEQKLINGEIKYLKMFTDSRDPNVKIYIIHRWQFTDLSEVKYTHSNI